VLSNSIQQLLLVITNGRQEVHARSLTSASNGPTVLLFYDVWLSIWTRQGWSSTSYIEFRWWISLSWRFCLFCS